LIRVLGPSGIAWLDALRARLDRQREILDLHAGVVIVKLTRDRVALRFQQRRYCISERRLAAMADVQRTGRICGNKFDLHFPLAASVAHAIAGAQREDVRHRRLMRFGFEKKIDESGAGDFSFRDIGLCR